MFWSLMKTEQQGERSVLDAKYEGLMCPALVELVCEALGSSGEHPMGV